MYLTKTDYIHYLLCPKSLWLLKYKPEVYPRKEFSAFLQKITRDGYEVESYAQMLFPGGVSLPTGSHATLKTKEALSSSVPALFQATVQTDDGLFARADILERTPDGRYDLYEVKSSSSVKKDKKHNHIKDACFQKIAFEQSGVSIRNVYLMHIDGTYVRGKSVDPHKLLARANITTAVEKVFVETEIEVKNALGFLASEQIGEGGCACYLATRSNHCDAFSYFNGPLPERSVWELGGIREKKLGGFLGSDITLIKDVPADADLNDRQLRQVRSSIEGRPIVNDTCIAEMLRAMEFPLYFFDYEASVSAVPKIVGTRPWQQIPFQFSLHVLEESGTLSHKEYLSESLDGSEGVLQALQDFIGPTGSVVSWHASFEKMLNREMGKMYPSYASFLDQVNDHMVDLEDIFKEAYTDAAFCGSTSIKKVLPVLCPELSYKHLGVQDGTQAMEQWFALVEGDLSEEERSVVRTDLLVYCKLDTFAMVALYRYLKALVSA